jgi:PPOX class probable F420-dependent enzyme
MPRLSAAEAQRRFLAARVARLATVSRPHLVPVTFALAAPDTLVTAVDHKPKRTTALVRLDHIAAHPAVSLLVDHYDEDWSQLWWARADGRAVVLTPDEQASRRAAVIAPLVERYEQYAARPPAGPAILVSVTRWSGWQAAD